jgi:hypothetical protein
LWSARGCALLPRDDVENHGVRLIVLSAWDGQNAHGLEISQHDRDGGASPWLGRDVGSSWRGFAKFAVYNDCSGFNDSVNADCFALLALTSYLGRTSSENGSKHFPVALFCLFFKIHVCFVVSLVVQPSLLLSACRASLDWFFSPACPFTLSPSPILHISSNAVNPDKSGAHLPPAVWRTLTAAPQAAKVWINPDR